jgi:hypothetical protein
MTFLSLLMTFLSPGNDSLRQVTTLFSLGDNSFFLSSHSKHNGNDPSKSVTYISEHLLPMSPVYTLPGGEEIMVRLQAFFS